MESSMSVLSKVEAVLVSSDMKCWLVGDDSSTEGLWKRCGWVVGVGGSSMMRSWD